MGPETGGFSVPGGVTSMGRYSQPLLGDIAHWDNPCRRSLVSATGNNSGDRRVASVAELIEEGEDLKELPGIGARMSL